MSKPGRRAKWALVGAAFALIPLLLVVFEVATRILRPHLDPLTVFVSSPQLRSDTQGENTSGMFEFDPLLTWKIRPNLRSAWWDFTPVTTNSRGIRMKREITAKKPGSLRIVTLGDSVTFGYRVPVAFDRNHPHIVEGGQPYPALLEEIIRAKFAGRVVEVIPLACPGYTSRQGLEWLRRDIAELQPDIVTACFGWNDIRSAGLPDRETFPSRGGQVLARKLISRSQGLLYLTADAAVGNASANANRKPEPRSSPEEYVAHFEEMAAICRQHGVWFGIILPVYRDPNTPDTEPLLVVDPEEGRRMGEYRNILRKAGKERDIPMLEIPELMETNWPASKPLFGERIHPNAEGHQLMAERIAGFLPPR